MLLENITFIRKQGCTLPIEIWEIGDKDKWVFDQKESINISFINKRIAYGHVPLATRGFNNIPK